MVSNATSSVQWSSREVGQLINLIRRENHLYNMDNPDYSIRETVDASWQDIADRIGKSVRECRDKWYNLRTVYRRMLREARFQLATTGRAKSSRWVWRDSMAFLLPYLRVKGCTNSFTSINDTLAEVDARATDEATDESSVAADGGRDAVVKFEVLDELSAASLPPSPPPPPPSPPPAKRPRLEPVLTVEDSEDEATVFPGDQVGRSCWSEESWQQQPSTSGNSDELFLRSLLPDVRALPPRQKGLFKVRVQQALFDAMFPKEKP